MFNRIYSKENLKDISQATNKIAVLEESIKKGNGRFNEIQEEFKLLDTSDSLKNAFETALTSLLNKINETLVNLNEQVRTIELKYYFDENKAKDAFLKELKQLDNSIENIRKDYLYDALYEKNAWKAETHHEFIELLDGTKQTHQSLIDYFNDELNFEIFKLIRIKLLTNAAEYKQIGVYYDGKELSSCSFGQRCTAAIVLLLFLGNTPIIIDEPEAHLDSALIARYLVNLVKDTKQNRQIIFATHNANFVINGDSELINILRINETTQKSEIEPITIENTTYRQDLMSLEGGHDAFKHRERRYLS